MDLRAQLLPSWTAQGILQAELLQKRGGGLDVVGIQAHQQVHRKLQLRNQHVPGRKMVRGLSLLRGEVPRLLHIIREEQDQPQFLRQGSDPARSPANQEKRGDPQTEAKQIPKPREVLQEQRSEPRQELEIL